MSGRANYVMTTLNNLCPSLLACRDSSQYQQVCCLQSKGVQASNSEELTIILYVFAILFNYN